MNDDLARILESVDSLEGDNLNECIMLLGWLLEKACYSGFSENDYKELLEPSIRIITLSSVEVSILEKKLEELYLTSGYDDVRSCVVWALGKSNTDESCKMLKRFLLRGVEDREVGYQLALALENLSADIISDLSSEQVNEMIEKLQRLGQLEERIRDVVERIIQRIGKD